MSIKEPSFMTEIVEDHENEIDEAATSLVMFSEQVYDFDLPPNDDDETMDLDQLTPIQEKILDCVEWILELREMISHSGFEKSTTCSDVVAAQALPKLQSNSSRKCNICGKSFGCYQALGGHQRVHRPIRGKLARKKEYAKDDNSLFESSDGKKIVSKPSKFEVSKEEKILDCVESKQEFSEQLPLNSKSRKIPESSSCYECKICGKSFGCYQALGGHTKLHRSMKGQLARTQDDSSLLDSSEAKKIVSQPSRFEVSPDEKSLHCVELKQDFSEPSYDCKICGKSFVCSQALGNHKRVHRPINGKLARKRKYTEDYNSLSDSVEAKKIVLEPSIFEFSPEENILHCVELKQDFGELLSHSGALPSTLRSKLQKKNQRKSSYDCKICGKSFVCSQALGNHKRVHRPINGKLACKRRYTEDYNPLSDSLEAKKIVLEPSIFEVSQEKSLHCVEFKQDFGELLAHSGFDKSISCSNTKFIPLPSSLRSKSHSNISIKGKLTRKNENTEDGNSLFGVNDSEASKFASLSSSFEIYQEKTLHCVESKQDFSELFSHSGLDKSTC
ncbi:Zinc finger C2H2-type [Arabidopsis thaliana x Arabidopsis arenosa]|uniref:Zinc finger C2H2-type n=1 Tax=Arabidopsis thaliana x Arabidopsis arenosa TaxID=1240361 RepID=A0A8T1ZIH9_9BRAS|nr:Zinc finger C2H2-type [Arabidopsis thaliana x Arabidopsis arenosa]